MRNQGNSVLAAPLGWVVRKANGGYDRFFNPERTMMVSLEPEGSPRGRVLIAQKVEGYLAEPDDPLLSSHNNLIEGRLLPGIFLQLGYGVDFISYLNYKFKPKRHYDLFLGSRTYFERLAAKLPPSCIKIVHLDIAHWLYNNATSLRRLQEVQARRNVALESYKPIEMNRAIEAADCATLLGNDFTYETYAFAGKRIFEVPNPMTIAYPWIEDKDFEACRNRFLWLATFGLVHKGLDLVLEAFSRMPDMHLTVCGPIDRDVHFARAYHRELYETPNIHTHGWIDIAGSDFADLRRRTLAMIYPSCAEGSCGSVINCMVAGLIPLGSRASGVDIAPHFGIELEALSVEAVMAAVRRIAGLPADQLEALARAAWTTARQTYSQERYRQVFTAVIEEIVAAGHAGLKSPGFVRANAGAPPAVGSRRAV